MKDLWSVFNGKKTNIGATMLIISVVITKIMDIWGLQDMVTLSQIVQTLDYVGGLLSGVGLTHKVVKQQHNNKK